MENKEFLKDLDKRLKRNERLVQKELKISSKLVEFATDSFESLEKINKEINGKLNSAKQTEEAHTQNIERLENKQCLQEREKIELKKRLVDLNKECEFLKSKLEDDFEVNARDTCIMTANEQRQWKAISQNLTNLYIEQNSHANVLKGFAGNRVNCTPFPFEYDTSCMSKKEISEKLWEHIGSTSNHLDEWEELINMKPSN